MTRLVVVSNRVADLEKSVQSGGLAVALGDALRDGRGIWLGWDGRVVDELSEDGFHYANVCGIVTGTVPLTTAEYDQYYVGFCNNVLWPAFHYRLDLARMDSGLLEGYRSVNQRFACSLVALLRPGDTIWVHDYHLMPLAEELRARGVRQRIGYFLHIPFPPPDIFAAVPEHKWLATALLAYDVIGFQTTGDKSNFLRFLSEELGIPEPQGNTITLNGRTIIVDAFPIGIDVEAFHALAQTDEATAQIERLQRRNVARSQVLGVDRLDYTKGLPDRLRAFRRLFELHPENIKAVTLMQIAPPTREDVAAYAEIRNELEGLSGAINGEFGDFDWTPVRYIHRAVPRHILAALYRGSHAGLVTPLRDGMNLVAKEYVAAQDADDPGVLILSRFAGAAEDLTEALIVNPYNTDEVAEALERALRMPLMERRERYEALIARVREHDVANWRATFMRALTTHGAELALSK